MNLDAKIAAATRCLEREYPNGIEASTLDYVIAEITREHEAEQRRRITARVQAAVAALGALLARLKALAHSDTPPAAANLP